MKRISSFFEKQAYGVCAYWGERLGIASASIRLFFIYLSFLTFGSPIIIYMGLVFIMNMHKHLRNNRKPVWDI
jgi:phage shock protein C